MEVAGKSGARLHSGHVVGRALLEVRSPYFTCLAVLVEVDINASFRVFGGVAKGPAFLSLRSQDCPNSYHRHFQLDVGDGKGEPSGRAVPHIRVADAIMARAVRIKRRFLFVFPF